MDTKAVKNKRTTTLGFLLILIFHNLGLSGQEDYVWEIDNMLERDKRNVIKHDSVIRCMRKKVMLSVGYGKWYFSNSAKSNNEEELFFLSDNMGQWRLMLSWNFFEKLAADISVNYQMEKNVPTPDIMSIMSGEDVEIDGGGGGMGAVQLGIKYYLRKALFRPYIHSSYGIVTAKSQYTKAEGNMDTGINSTDYTFESKANLYNIGSGIDYRLGKNISFCLDFNYAYSNPFDEPIGGYNSYRGFSITANLAIVF